MQFSDKPENEFLICCARAQLDPKTTDRIHSLVQENIDWEYIVKGSIRQKVMPLLYQSLKTMCPQNVPDDILAKLRHYFLINSSRNLFLSGKLLKILNLLRDNGILAIPFKGPVLAESVYGDLTLRQFVDLDILVHKHNVIKSRNLLVSNGYQAEIELNKNQEKAYIKAEYSFSIISNDCKVNVDLHWELSSRYTLHPFDLEMIEERLEPATIVDKKVLQFSAEDLLFFLCLHGATHCWINLEMVSSVAELLNSRPAIDFVAVKRLAKKLRSERILFLGLFMAHDLFGTTLPDHILKMIGSDLKIPKLAKQVYSDLFHENGKVSQKWINPRFSPFHLAVREHISDRIRYGLQLATTATVEDWRRLPLPAQLWFLHYLYRPVRLIVGLLLILMRRYLIKRQ